MKKAADFKITKKKNGRFLVKKRGGGTINGDAKTKILIDTGTIKAKMKKAAPAEEAAPQS